MMMMMMMMIMLRTAQHSTIIIIIIIPTVPAAYPDCLGAVPNFSALEGLKIGPGWNKQVRERVGGTKGCTHLIEMMAQLATVAVQSLWGQIFDDEGEGPDATTSQLDACWGYRSNGEVIRRYFPAQYTGELAADLARDTDRPGAAK